MSRQRVLCRVTGGARRREVQALAKSLSAHPPFTSFGPAQLEPLVAAGQDLPLPAGWTFLHEGTPADACYVLLEGEVRVLVHGAVRPLLGPGAVLGEMGLFGHCLRRASVVTTTPVRVLRIEYDALAAVLATHPSLARSFGAVYEEHRAADQHQGHRASRGVVTQVSGG